MEVREFSCEDGHLSRVKVYDNFHFPFAYPGNVKDQLELVANLNIRENDVMISTYPKSGTHWVKEIADMLLRGKAEYIDEHLMSIDYMPIQDIEKLPSPRILQSHLPYRYLPNDLRRRGRIIYVTRNPKDMAVSLHFMTKKLNHYFSSFTGSFNALLHCVFYSKEFTFQYGNWFDYVKDWEKVIQQENRGCKILHLQYESLKSDLKSNVKKISDFLDINCDEELLEQISEKCTFKNMKNAKESNPHPIWKLSTVDGEVPIFRKGEVGDWKNWFTEEENAKFEKEYLARMKDTNLTFQFSN